MKERNDESTNLLRRVKRKEHSRSTLLPHSINNDDILDHNRRGRKATSLFRQITRNCFFLQLALAVFLLFHWTWYSYFQAPSSIESSIELLCKNSSVWASDGLWRTSVERPRVCPPKRGDATVDWEQRGLDAQQLQETISFRTPCGAYCAFHTNTLSFANSVVAGWQLIDRSGKGSHGCWEPMLDTHTHFCSKWFDDWKAWMAESKSVSTPSRQDEDSKRRAQVLASMSEKVDSRCHNDASWANNSFWRNSVENPAVCFIGIPRSDESLNLGVSHLIDSLATGVQCGSYCVFHWESSPIHAVEGSAVGRKLKGWSLGDLETGHGKRGCFRPIEDIRSSHCNEWYKQWTIWVNSTVAGSS